MQTADVIIVGGGAAGLMAGRELTRAGHSIILLEAQNRLGGRIHTLHNTTYDIHFELGAEFVHGHLPITLGLLDEAGIPYKRVQGHMWQASSGNENPATEHTYAWDLFEDKLKELKEDMTVSAFLDNYFGGDQFQTLRASVKRYVSGYDTANPDDASILGFGDELIHEDHSEQYRVEKGYAQMIHYLEQECRKGDCEILLSHAAKSITWKEGHVEVIADKGTLYTSKKILIAVPLSILTAPENDISGIHFAPAIPEAIQAAHMIGYGDVIKILLLFTEPFWEQIQKGIGFAFSSERIPTWWTQYPENSGLLTGWLGGPPADSMKQHTEAEILDISLQSLANMFDVTREFLKSKLLDSHILLWGNNPYCKGSYSYAKMDTEEGKRILNEPIANTLFFCGEALSTEAEAGTVEAALDSGRKIATTIITDN